MKRNPWALTEEQAAEREDAILDQFIAARSDARRRFVHPDHIVEALQRQFGSRGGRIAIDKAINRKARAQ